MSDLKERIMAKMGLKSIPVPSAQPAPLAPASGPPEKKPKKKRRVPSRQITRQQAEELGLRPLLEILSAEEVAKYLPTAEAAGARPRHRRRLSIPARQEAANLLAETSGALQSPAGDLLTLPVCGGRH